MKDETGKWTLISRYDQCSITDSEIAYRTENLAEFERILETIMDKLDEDIPSQAAMKQLYNSNDLKELVKQLAGDKDTAKIVEEMVSADVYNDHDIYSLYWRDEQECVRAEWDGSGFSGYYRAEDDSEYVYYREGVDLLHKTIKGHYSEDYEMWRRPNGYITIGIGCRRYTYVPVEVGYKGWIGRCVIDGENIYRLTGYESYEGSYAEFTTCSYDPQLRKFSEQIMHITERDLLTDNDGRVHRMTLREAVHTRRVIMCVERLSGMGITPEAGAFGRTLFDLRLSGIYAVPNDLRGESLYAMLNVLGLLRSGKGYIVNLQSREDLEVRMFEVLLRAEKHSQVMVRQAHAIRNELARSIGSIRASLYKRADELPLAA